MNRSTKHLIWGTNLENLWEKPKDDSSHESNNSTLEIVNNRIYFYSEISREHILTLNKALREKSSEYIRQQIILDLEQIIPIYLHINSYGGSVVSGLSGMDNILLSKSPIYTIVDGVSASAATLLSLVGKKRFITKNSVMLIHQISSMHWGKYNELKDEMENTEMFMSKLKEIYGKYTKIPLEKLDEILKHDLYFDAETCLKYKMVDKII